MVINLGEPLNGVDIHIEGTPKDPLTDRLIKIDLKMAVSFVPGRKISFRLVVLSPI
jgi:hypothetical protein